MGTRLESAVGDCEVVALAGDANRALIIANYAFGRAAIGQLVCSSSHSCRLAEHIGVWRHLARPRSPFAVDERRQFAQATRHRCQELVLLGVGQVRGAQAALRVRSARGEAKPAGRFTALNSMPSQYARRSSPAALNW